MKTPYPFHPLEDSTLVQVFHTVLTSVSKEDLLLSLRSNLLADKENFFFTTRTDKQTFFQLFPPKARKWIEEKEFSEFENTFKELLSANPEQKLDVCLEVLEWILSGFEEPELFTSLTRLLTNGKIQFPEDFYMQCRNEYEKTMASDLISGDNNE